MNTLTGRYRKPYIDRGNYHRYSLSINGVIKTISAHRLVAIAFIPNPDNKRTVDHINRRPNENHVGNLRWATAKEQADNRVVSKNESWGDTASDLPGEVWLPLIYPHANLIAGYRVSNKGRIQLPRKKTYGTRNADGYKKVSLETTNKKRIPVLVHRAVALTFLGVPDNVFSLVVNHLDGRRDNNSVENLEWATKSENSHHAFNILNPHLLVPVASYDPIYGRLLSVHASKTQASKDTNQKLSSIDQAVSKKCLAGGRFWVQVSNMDKAPPSIDLGRMREPRKKRICQYAQDTGELVKIHDSLAEAAKEISYESTNLLKAIKNRRARRGFFWTKCLGGDIVTSIDVSQFHPSSQRTPR